MIELSPIALFVYNRPVHTLKVLKALSRNPEASQCELIVFCDGPKKNALKDDLIAINSTIEIVRNERRFKSVKVIENKENLGLANSIIRGVSEVLLTNEKVIVLEDDILPEKGFLSYMNNALNLYENDEEVGCIHAWNYTFKNNKIVESTFFLKGGDCWGWGTWKRAWSFFEQDGRKLKTELESKKQIESFNRNNTHQFYEMLNDQIDGKNNSWAIRWHASLFLANKYCLHPTFPLVKNIGLDGTGTHCDAENIIQLTTNKIKLTKHSEIKENKEFFNSFKQGVKTKLTRWEKLKHYLR